MIMPNRQQENNFASIFTNILHIAGEYWSEIDRNKLNKIASGFIVAGGNRMIKAELSLNDVKSRLSLIIRFKPKCKLVTSDIINIIHFQNRITNLCSSLNIDDEDNIVILKTVTPVYEQDPAAAVKSLFEDTFTVLDDDEFSCVIN